MTFGIPIQEFPIGDDYDTFPLGNHQKWTTERLKLESMETTDERVLVPGRFDILMGRSWTAQLQPGNIRFRHIVAKHWEVYEKARKHEKTAIAKGVVQEVKATGSRFLKSDGAGWVLVDDTVAREKVSSAFRDRRKVVHAKALDAESGGLEEASSGSAKNEEKTGKHSEAKAIRRGLDEVAFDCAKKGDDFVDVKRLKRNFPALDNR